MLNEKVSPERDDAALMAAAKAGDAAALGELIERFRNYLTRVAADDLDPRVRSRVRPSDVVQETFLEAVRLFERFDGRGAADLLNWMRGILANKVREAGARHLGVEKRDPRRETDFATEPAADGPTPSAECLREEQATRVLAAVARLSPEYRQVIRWRAWDELGFAEIGTRLGRSEDAARMLFGRALKCLEGELADAAPATR